MCMTFGEVWTGISLTQVRNIPCSALKKDSLLHNILLFCLYLQGPAINYVYVWGRGVKQRSLRLFIEESQSGHTYTPKQIRNNTCLLQQAH